MPPATDLPGSGADRGPEPGATAAGGAAGGPAGGPPPGAPVPGGATAPGAGGTAPGAGGPGGPPIGGVGEAGDRLGYDGDDDGDHVFRRRRAPHRSRLPVFLAVGAFVALAVAGIAVGIATRDDGDGRAGSTSPTTDAGDRTDGTCPTGPWPAVAQGQPDALRDAAETGYYVWNDAFGWHVRMVDTGEVPGRFSGEVVSSANLTASEVIPEGSGEVRVSGNTLTWDFPGSAEPTGFDVAVGGCAADTVRFSLNDLNGPVAESRIFLGTNSTAVSNPLLVRRQG